MQWSKSLSVYLSSKQVQNSCLAWWLNFLLLQHKTFPETHKNLFCSLFRLIVSLTFFVLENYFRDHNKKCATSFFFKLYITSCNTWYFLNSFWQKNYVLSKYWENWESLKFFTTNLIHTSGKTLNEKNHINLFMNSYKITSISAW